MRRALIFGVLALLAVAVVAQTASRHRGRALTPDASWTPAQLTNIVDWATADDVTTDGEGVTHWTGREGVIVFGQITGSAKPQLSGGAVVFDGGDWMSNATSQGGSFGGPHSQPNTFFARVKLDSIGEYHLWDGVGGSDRQISRTFTGPDEWDLWAGTQLKGSVTHSTGWRSLVAIYNGASSALRLDGSEVASGDGGAEVSGDGFILGARFNATGNLVGQMTAWGYMDGAVTGDDLADLELWLADQ